MIIFRVFLTVIFIAIFGYTAVVISNHGMGLLPIFFGDMIKMGWPGQFNLDFMCFLAISALWLSWRHHFSHIGIILGVAGLFGGSLFLSAYLFIESFRVKGDIKVLLLGKERAI
ncbi:MAG: hypothetical protein BWK80_31800 [Desulfobacteraceae bacterium IS3]|nr:MAG: hypothetical protein BWK80_31800 [Desulfobacteraceae bacterium IS3]